MKKKYYSVVKGREVGIFDNWQACKKSIDGFSGAIYKSFENKLDAENYLNNKHQEEKADVEKLSSDEMIAYVDGSFSGNIVGYGGVIIAKDFEDTFFGKTQNKDAIAYRNVAGELYAAVYAIKYALKAGKKKLYIYHDYTGIRHWALSEWKRNNELTQRYQLYFDSIKDEIEVKFIKVAAHTGDRYNEMADELAKKGAGIK